MKKVCSLSDEQSAKMKAIDEAWDKDSAKWQADNSAKVQAAQKALMEAIAKQDGAAIFKAYEAMKAAQAPLVALHDKACSQIMAVLTADQKAAWQEHTVLKSISAWFEPAKLTDKQLADIKSAYAELAKGKDAKCDEIMVTLAEKTRDMLTAEQLKGIAPFMLHMEKTIHLGGGDSAPHQRPARQASATGRSRWMPARCSRARSSSSAADTAASWAQRPALANSIAIPDSAE